MHNRVQHIGERSKTSFSRQNGTEEEREIVAIPFKMHFSREDKWQVARYKTEACKEDKIQCRDPAEATLVAAMASTCM